MTLTHRLLGSTAIILLAGSAMAETLTVTSTANAGEGSLRAAIEAAAASDTASTIIVAARGDIAIDSTLSYEGTAPLSIFGAGQTVITANNVTLLAAPNGADLSVTGLGFAGPGGWSIENRGDLDGFAGKGIFVGVPTDATGDVTLSLTNVRVSGVANHGVHVSDCSLADDCGGGGGGAGDGSAAGITVNMFRVTIEDVGHGKFDADGLRVDERGPGSIRWTVSDSMFTGVGADGVELDEGQDGDVIVDVSASTFNANGAYCNPDLLSPFVPVPDEAEFEKGTMQEDAIPGPITGTADNSCIERAVDLYDDGSVEAYEFGIDLDDGFDIDEAGAGSVIATIKGSIIDNNLDEGLDFDEEGPGDIILTAISTNAKGNTDDGFKMSEEDEGAVSGTILSSMSMNNGGKGMVFEEADAGDVMITGAGVMTGGNDDMDDTGMELVQEDDGTGSASLSDSRIEDGFDLDGVDLSES